MATFTYTALRNLKSGHSIDTQYVITIELHQIDDEMPKPEKESHRTQDGGEVTVLSYIDTMINVTTDYIESDGTGTPDAADFLEFFHSVSAGEQFIFNNGSDIDVVMANNPSRTRTGTKFNYQFQMRVAA